MGWYVAGAVLLAIVGLIVLVLVGCAAELSDYDSRWRDE